MCVVCVCVLFFLGVPVCFKIEANGTPPLQALVLDEFFKTWVWFSFRVVLWLVGWFAGWLVGWLVGWLAGWLAGWLPGWLAGWLVGWLVG